MVSIVIPVFQIIQFLKLWLHQDYSHNQAIFCFLNFAFQLSFNFKPLELWIDLFFFLPSLLCNIILLLTLCRQWRTTSNSIRFNIPFLKIFLTLITSCAFIFSSRNHLHKQLGIIPHKGYDLLPFFLSYILWLIIARLLQMIIILISSKAKILML